MSAHGLEQDAWGWRGKSLGRGWLGREVSPSDPLDGRSIGHGLGYKLGRKSGSWGLSHNGPLKWVAK